MLNSSLYKTELESTIVLKKQKVENNWVKNDDIRKYHFNKESIKATGSKLKKNITRVHC